MNGWNPWTTRSTAVCLWMTDNRKDEMLKHDPELLEIFERFQGEVSDCAKLISPAEKALIAVVSLVAQSSHALLAYSVERALDAGRARNRSARPSISALLMSDFPAWSRR